MKRRLKQLRRLKPANRLRYYGLNDCEGPFREEGPFFRDSVFFAEKRAKKLKSGLPLSVGIGILAFTLKFGGLDGN